MSQRSIPSCLERGRTLFFPGFVSNYYYYAREGDYSHVKGARKTERFIWPMLVGYTGSKGEHDGGSAADRTD